MKILFFGDICGKTGRLALQKVLPNLIEKYSPDFIIANGENATNGKGINENAYNFLIGLGIDCLTTGDHAFDVKETEELIAKKDIKLIRPLNYPENKNIPGQGFLILEKKGKKLAVINLQGRVFMGEGLDNPFNVVDNLLKEKTFANLPTLVDFHTEATSEIGAMGWFLDGRVSAVLGTHTHIQTSDNKILPNGTGFISDVGMCGALNSVLGVKRDIVINRFQTGMKTKFEVADFPAIINGVFLDLENNKTKNIQSVSVVIEKN